ncbi:hypothetical protein LDO26_01065 [Luteimonas sp. BDR2-5]|uniref:hypothetical protein n=1 Tax=Proluteimonas luteida TaxID=2878685 RepID=UPI001E552FE2|nr:hypothetical protein [Luteimonas sp. BDR2-5]MCD9026806.1 hypothetical protein [Luteimonas sp. BDR2-5]
MSRHVVRSVRQDAPVYVVAGYDRPLHSLYLQVWEDPDAHSRLDNVVIYASHLDPRRDWSDIDSVVDALAALSVPVPGTFIDAIAEDQVLRRGNHLRCHPPMIA